MEIRYTVTSHGSYSSIGPLERFDEVTFRAILTALAGRQNVQTVLIVDDEDLAREEAERASRNKLIEQTLRSIRFALKETAEHLRGGSMIVDVPQRLTDCVTAADRVLDGGA